MKYNRGTIAQPNGWLYSRSMNKKTLSEVMRFLGRQTSKAKAAAARKNGMKGGRPPKRKR